MEYSQHSLPVSYPAYGFPLSSAKSVREQECVQEGKLLKTRAFSISDKGW